MNVYFTLFLVTFAASVLGQTKIKLDSITTLLEQVYKDDQSPRFHLDSLQVKYGPNSKEVLSFWKNVNTLDSLNKKVVISIIDKYGWLGPEVISSKANDALFLVIQHADVKTQIKYLPALKNAIIQGKAKAKDYAYLSDRIKMNTGFYQSYGTQIGYKGNLCFWPIKNELNVNRRRRDLGLDPIQDYAKNFNLIYKAPHIDSLKGNVILNCYLSDNNQHPLKSVNVYIFKSKFVAQTNTDGFIRIIIPRSSLQSYIIFKKRGYNTKVFREVEKGDVFYINSVLLSKVSN
jgi:hypothetical protein